eukprot:1897567-Pleurochrysis_carterae.AAC.4
MQTKRKGACTQHWHRELSEWRHTTHEECGHGAWMYAPCSHDGTSRNVVVEAPPRGLMSAFSSLQKKSNIAFGSRNATSAECVFTVNEHRQLAPTRHVVEGAEKPCTNSMASKLARAR